MVRRTVIPLIDDLDGRPIEKGNGETVYFALDSQAYEINLSDANARALRDLFATYVRSARSVGDGGSARDARRTRRAGGTAGSEGERDYDPREVRAWARARDLEIPARGRIPARVVEQFKQARGG